MSIEFAVRPDNEWAPPLLDISGNPLSNDDKAALFDLALALSREDATFALGVNADDRPGVFIPLVSAREE